MSKTEQQSFHDEAIKKGYHFKLKNTQRDR